MRPGTMSVADGATAPLFCATSEKAAGHSGAFFTPFGVLDGRAEKWTEDAEMVERVWDESERMVREAGF